MGHAVGYWLINLKIYERQMPVFSLKKKKKVKPRDKTYNCPYQQRDVQIPLYPAEEISLHKWVSIS